MNTTTDTGGPAFPQSDMIDDGQLLASGDTGMTLRDYFAAKAMQSLATETHEDIMEWNFDSDDIPTDAALAKAAYLIADAMLEARKK